MDQLSEGPTRAPSDRSSFGERVRRLRKEKGWTLTEVAVSSGLAPSTISKVERGQMSLTYDRLVLLARGLEVHLTELFGPTQCDEVRPPGKISITRAGHASPFPKQLSREPTSSVNTGGVGFYTPVFTTSRTDRRCVLPKSSFLDCSFQKEYKR